MKLSKKFENFIYKIDWLAYALTSGLVGGIAVLYLIVLNKPDRLISDQSLNDLVIINTSFMCGWISWHMYNLSKKFLSYIHKEENKED